MPHAIRPGDVLAGRYQLIDLLDESGGGLFYRAHDSSLDRSVAVHIIRADDERAGLLREAARTSARVVDRRLLRVLDVDETSDQTARDGSALCFVVNEWATGVSLDILLADDGPLSPRRAAWLIGEVAGTLEVAHAAGVSHGRLVPENVLIDRTGSVRVIGFAVDAALHGLPVRTGAGRRHRAGRAPVRRPDRPLARRRAVGRQARAARARPGAAAAAGPGRRPARARHALRRGAQPGRLGPGVARPRQLRPVHRGRHRRRAARVRGRPDGARGHRGGRRPPPRGGPADEPALLDGHPAGGAHRGHPGRPSPSAVPEPAAEPEPAPQAEPEPSRRRRPPGRTSRPRPASRSSTTTATSRG